MMITDTSFLRNPHYHEPTDTVESLDLGFFYKVVEGLIESFSKILWNALKFFSIQFVVGL